MTVAEGLEVDLAEDLGRMIEIEAERVDRDPDLDEDPVEDRDLVAEVAVRAPDLELDHDKWDKRRCENSTLIGKTHIRIENR